MNDTTMPRPTLQEQFRASPVLSVLALITFINRFMFFGISAHFGGDALGILPSTDGFVVTNHGHKTVVTESVWLFSLIYPYCTLMLTPAIMLLYSDSRMNSANRRDDPQIRMDPADVLGQARI